MKKQTQKLSLNKKTISNLQPSEMKNIIGGATSVYYSNPHSCGGGGQTRNGNTCPGHNTCNYC